MVRSEISHFGIAFLPPASLGRGAMRTLLIIAIGGAAFVVQAGTVDAQAATTVADYPACLTKEWLDDFQSFALAKDMASADAYVRDKKCIVVRGGLQVTITDLGVIKSEFAYNGFKFWTLTS